MSIRTALPALVAAAGLTLLTAACSSDSSSSDSTAAAPASVVDTTAATTAVTETAATEAAPSTPEASSPESTTAGTAAGGDGGEGGLVVDIAGFKFGPEEIDVTVGDTITWTNSDAQAHTATASGTFDTGSIAAGAMGTATFDTAGTYEYICSFHPFMHGTVVVS